MNADGWFTDRVTAWFGASMAGGKLTIDANGNEVTLERGQGMAAHMAGEDANLCALIKEVYAENATAEQTAAAVVK